MIGSNPAVLADILNHPDCPFKNGVRDRNGKHIPAEELHRYIMDQYWKRWKVLMRTTTKSHIECTGLGYFDIKHQNCRAKCYSIVRSLRKLYENPDSQIEGTLAYSLVKSYKKSFAIVWEQMNNLRREHIQYVKDMNKSLIRRGRANEIRRYYE